MKVSRLAKKKTAAKKTDSSQPTFEQSLAKVEEIVEQLEDGGLGLSECLRQYEQGIGHLKQCHAALESAERKIELLTGFDSDGNPVTQPFSDEADSLEEKSRQRSQRRSRQTGGAKSRDVDEPPSLF